MTVLRSLPATWLSVVPAWDQCCNSDHHWPGYLSVGWDPFLQPGCQLGSEQPAACCLQPGSRAAYSDHLLRQPACQLSLPGISATAVRRVAVTLSWPLRPAAACTGLEGGDRDATSAPTHAERAVPAGAGLPWKWWALRTAALQQRTLSGPAAALQAEIEQLSQQVLCLLAGSVSIECWRKISSREDPISSASST